MRWPPLPLDAFAFAAAPFVALVLSVYPPSVRPAPAAGNHITDMMGREAFIPASPTRVVTLAPILPAYLTIDGGSGHVVAAEVDDARGILDSPLAKVYPGVRHIQSAGGIAPKNPEDILLFNPDAVVLWNTNLGALRNMHMPNLVEIRFRQGDPVHQNPDRLALWPLLAKITGRADRADAEIAGYQQKVAQLQTELPTTRPKPRVIVLQGVNRSWLIENSSYLPGYALDFVGADNLAGSGGFGFSPRLDAEAILKLNPDIILLDPDITDRFPDDLYREPALRNVSAIKTRHVYTVPHFDTFMPIVDDPLLLRWMAETLFPDRMNCGLRSLIRDTYQEVYGFTISDDDIDRFLMLKQNGISANYQRFARNCGDAASRPHGT